MIKKNPIGLTKHEKTKWASKLTHKQLRFLLWYTLGMSKMKICHGSEMVSDSQSFNHSSKNGILPGGAESEIDFYVKGWEFSPGTENKSLGWEWAQRLPPCSVILSTYQFPPVTALHLVNLGVLVLNEGGSSHLKSAQLSTVLQQQKPKTMREAEIKYFRNVF